jgi:hypothetical protein
MKKVWLVVVTVVMLGGFLVTTANAAQLCWQVDSTNDLLDGYINATVYGGKLTRAVHGGYYAQGGLYFPMAGNMVKSPDDSKWYLQLNTNLFDSYVGMLITLNASTLSGAGNLIVIADDRNVYSQTFTNISCKALPAPTSP